MAITDANGNILSKSALQGKGTTVTQPTKYTINEDIYETYTFPGDASSETRRRKLYYAGQVVGQDAIDGLSSYQTATVTSVTPSTGLATAGGTVVTIKGTNFNGVTGVTFGGTAGTNLKKISKTELKVNTPAKTAGSHAVVVNGGFGTAAGGNVTFA